MIELKGVSKSYAGQVVLPQARPGHRRGARRCSSGRAAAASSTLLRLMIGLVQPDTGTITIEGKPLTPETVLEVRRGLGYVTQDGGLFPISRRVATWT